MPRKLLRRLGSLYRLLWIDERMTTIESTMMTREARSRERIDRLRNRVDRLSGRIDNSMNLMDYFKSNLEVSPELIDEFAEWKTRNPIPERPLVSVIVATYNRPGPLMNRCVPSILGQTYDNLELIVVGDGCTDETEELLAAVEDPRLRFINLSERSSYPEDPYHRWLVAGVPPRNQGLEAASGEFITYLDDDDAYALDRLEKLVKFASEEGCDLVWHPFWFETADNEWALIEAQNFMLGQVTTSSVLYRSWFKRIPWNLEAYRLMEPDDWNLFRRIMYMNPVCRRYPEPLHKHYKEISPDHLVSNLFDPTHGVE